ncbi:MAG TPA: Gfo/Idh/MocA family oxidoreductase [Chthoniobacteraceae bacterium]|nr:Gfo/Idh/MocA family oxidoreductase [Chthoniobacteraceae bacterium]
MNPPSSLTRRTFIQKSAKAGALLSALPVERYAHAAAGGGPLKLGMVGCGGRATGAANQALHASENIKLVAVGELFRDKVDLAIQSLKAQNGDKVDVSEGAIFLGFDAYKNVIAAADVVILATPSLFRPQMFEEAVRQGKHIFMEKPVACDAPGIRRLLAAAEDAKKKNLKVGVGLQRRHKPGYLEAVKRVQDGALGQILYYRTFWDMGAARAFVPRKPEWSELELQLRNQFYFAWECGDIIVDQGLHNIDVANWMKGDYPVSAKGVAGAEVRRGHVEDGCLYDHFAIEFEYADGTRLFHQNRQIPGCWNYVAECAHGTLGSSEFINDRTIFNITGKNEWRYKKEEPIIDPYQQEHIDLIDAIVNDKPYMEAERGAKSTMTAIMGRMAGYSGQLIQWDDAIKSEERMTKIITSLDDEPPVKPDEHGAYPLPVPGKSRAV